MQEPTKECYYCGRALFRHDNLSPWLAYDIPEGGDATVCPVKKKQHRAVDIIDIRESTLKRWRRRYSPREYNAISEQHEPREGEPMYYLSSEKKDALNRILAEEAKANGVCEDGLDAVYEKVNAAVGFTLLKRPPPPRKKVTMTVTFEAPHKYDDSTLNGVVRNVVEYQAGVYVDHLKNLEVHHTVESVQ